MRSICIISLLFIIIVSPSKANTLKCNFFFKNVEGSRIFTRALFVPGNDPYRVDFSLAEASSPPKKKESALSWETPFDKGLRIFFQTSIYPRVKKYPKTTALDWTLSNFRLPTGTVSNVKFHVSIKTRGSDGFEEVTMDAMSDIDTSAYFSASGECKRGSAEVIRVLKSKSKTSSSSSSTNSNKKVLKPVIPVQPAYKTGTVLNSLNIYFKNGQSMDFMCQLEAVIQNVTTQKKTIVPFFPNIDGTGQEILKTDLENEFSSNLPLLKHLNIRIQNLSDSSCAPKNVSDIQLFKNSFSKLINIDQAGNIEIPNFELKNLP